MDKTLVPKFLVFFRSCRHNRHTSRIISSCFPPRQRESHPRNWKAHSQKVCWVILVVERPRNDAPLRDKEKPPGGNSKLTAASFIHLDLPTKKLEKETTRHKVLLIFFLRWLIFWDSQLLTKHPFVFGWAGKVLANVGPSTSVDLPTTNGSPSDMTSVLLSSCAPGTVPARVAWTDPTTTTTTTTATTTKTKKNTSNTDSRRGGGFWTLREDVGWTLLKNQSTFNQAPTSPRG